MKRLFYYDYNGRYLTLSGDTKVGDSGASRYSLHDYNCDELLLGIL